MATRSSSRCRSSRSISLVIIGHSFVARNREAIHRFLRSTSFGDIHIAEIHILAHGGAIFGDSNFLDYLHFLSTYSFSYPLIIMSFLSDNDIFPRNSDSYADMPSTICGVVPFFGYWLDEIRRAANPIKIYQVTPAVRRGRHHYNGLLPFIEYSLLMFAGRKPWLHILSREGRGGSDVRELSPDGIHPLSRFVSTWVTDYISLAIQDYLTTLY